jgi:sec-independent protein translocase protein TatB
VFDLSVGNILVLAVLALILFGPERLPKVASQAGRALRDLRRIAESAKADLQEGLGPEFRDFDIAELNPKTFVRKHLWEEFDGTNGGSAAAPAADAPQPSTPEPSTPEPSTPPVSTPQTSTASHNGTALLSPGERPPYDAEAT